MGPSFEPTGVSSDGRCWVFSKVYFEKANISLCGPGLPALSGRRAQGARAQHENIMEMEENYEWRANAEAAHTFPLQAGHIRKGGLIMIKGAPCKVIDVSVRQPGKHGHTKCHFVGKELFSGTKMETVLPHGHATDVPILQTDQYMIVPTWYDECTIDGGCYLTLMDLSTMETRKDLKLPGSLAPRVFELFKKSETDSNMDVAAVVLKACGREMICDVKAMTQSREPG